jgi:hypothetical protein
MSKHGNEIFHSLTASDSGAAGGKPDNIIDTNSDSRDVRRSERVTYPSWKVQDNHEREVTRAFWNVVKDCKYTQKCVAKINVQSCPEIEIEKLIDSLLTNKSRLVNMYTKVREAFKGLVPFEIRQESDRQSAELTRARLLLQPARSEVLSSASATESRRKLLAAQTASLKVERAGLEISRLETEEVVRQAQFEADEKVRRTKIEAELSIRRRVLDEQRIKTELDRAEAEMSELGDGSQMMGGFRNAPIALDPTVNSFHNAPIAPDPTVNSFYNTPIAPESTVDGFNNAALADLMHSLTDSVNRNRLPVPEPPVFTGSPLQYPAWKSAFAALIDSRNIPASERIHYLKRYLEGEAKEAVEGVFYFDTEEAYTDARNTLEERYGNQFLISEAFRTKLDSWPKVNGNDSKGLRKLADFLRQCLLAMDHVPTLKILDDCRENQKILYKLPEWLARRWSRIVAVSRDTYPPFKDFVKFVAKESDIASNPITALRSLNINEDKRRPAGKPSNRPAVARALASESVKPVNEKMCIFCKKTNHYVSTCHQFKNKTPAERKEFLLKGGICFGCLSHGHLSKNCPKKSLCEKCQKRHPTILHGDYEALHPSTDHTEPKQRTGDDPAPKQRTGVNFRAANQDSATGRCSMIIPVYLSSSDDPDNECLVYALLDTQSDTTFVLEETGESLNATSEPTRLKLSTMTSTSVIDCQRYTGLQIRGMGSSERIQLPESYSRSFIPVNKSHIPTPEVAERWSHLRNLSTKIAPMQNCEVGLLIGYDCPAALAPIDVVRGTEDEPFAVRTELGWTVVGRTMCETDEEHISHRVLTKAIPDELQIHARDEINFVCRTKISEESAIPQIIKILENDFQEKKRETVMSQDDLKFLKIIQPGIHQDADGYYEMPLPFRDGKPQLPDNKDMAKKRLDHLKRRFKSNTKYFEDYRLFMNNILNHGDAEEVASEDADSTTNWYIPHHGIYNPKKPDKIRVVFDCSARYKGACLNDHLLQGPDLMNSLVGVLCRFREKPIAVMGDVERMFHQFRVEASDRNFLRFLWWKDGKIDHEPTVYRMKVHLFGATSSPGCANFGLKKLAADHREDFSSDVCDFLTSDFYVDDGLRSCETTQEAIKLVQDSRELCAKGNLRLHKFTSNSKEVMQSIPESERAKESSTQDMNLGDSPIERVLGVQWSVTSDQFCFRLTLKEKPMTRRGVLSTVASVFDPLGCVAPFVLIGKQILQQMCKDNVGWDEPLSESLRPRWAQWIAELPKLAQLQIPRCFVPENFGPVVCYELHHFSDASVNGYGQCSYVRVINQNHDVHCALVMGKARVSPLKFVSIPRLELAAALVSVKISDILRTEMTYENVQEYFWTDSKVVLGYIANDARRFHVFVANRVEQIRNSSEPSQWKYVESANNPADHASRGLHADELTKSNWFHGPAFLWKHDVLVEQPLDTQISIEDPEVRKVIVNKTETTTASTMLERLSRFSDWYRAVAGIAVLLHHIHTRKQKDSKPPLLEDDRHSARMTIIRLVQSASFSDSIESLTEGGTTSDKILRTLDPFIDEEGILRVGGRLSRSTMKHGVKHPIILPNPKSSHVVSLIIKHQHESIAHQGRGFTINALRESGYWIIGCSRAVSSMIHRCVTCRKHRGTCQTQKMAQLPEDRTESAPPFSYCGIDCFGPFVVKDGRRELKRYGLLITCMASRAVHIETLDDMTTDTFINGLRCFIAIRGPVRVIRCDQGTNFVGAHHELKKAMKEIVEPRIRNFLAANSCDFQMNSPHSSHMGGTWERQIRTVRSVLTALLDQHGTRLDTSSLRTLLYEAMAIINSRPLTAQNLNDPLGPEPLTPNNLITMKSKLILPPPGNFVKEDVFARKRWRKVQFLADEFWSRWRKEYLSTLQVRQKWHKEQRNMTVGDVVILKDDSLVRGQWRLAKIVDTVVDKDGLVRRVRIRVGDPGLSALGKRLVEPTTLDRPIHKLTLLLENESE